MTRVRLRAGARCELQSSSMFDMGFQLLAFFILTFRPALHEPQVSLRLPPPQRVATHAAPPDGEGPQSPPTGGAETLLLGILSTPGGAPRYAIGDTRFPTLAALDTRMRQVFADPAQPFRQVVIEVDAEVRYEHVLAVVERCTRQRLRDGHPLNKVSLVERSEP